jgi:hypothetical protein
MAALYRLSLGCGLSMRSYSCDEAPDATGSRIITIHGQVSLRPAASEKSKGCIWKRKTYLFSFGPGQFPGVISSAAAMLRVHPTPKINNPSYFG